jgi:uncharacterized protein (DUF2235 family)
MGEQSQASATGHSAKSIVLFSDGTGNSSGKLFKTNVFRLYEAVDLGPGQPKQQRQIAFYDDGVGTSNFRPVRMVQGIFGFGLKRNVLEIYAYACRNYDPDSVPIEGSGIDDRGDQIYGFGFSRGAFTMRLVIGLIADQGLVPYTTEEDLAWKTRAAWKKFRRKWPRSIETMLRWMGKGTAETAILADELRARKGSRPADKESAGTRRYDPSQNHRPVIRFIGVWDTVAAYGGPISEITRAIDNFIYRLSMPNYALNPRIRCARHALALDDARDSFHPLLWDEYSEDEFRKQYPQAAWLQGERLRQVWFAGMHADVGGGYPDESLSYVSLLWMLEEAHKCGLRTVDYIVDRYHGLANSFGPLHNSRAGMAGYYRYQPRRIESWLEDRPSRTLSLRDPAIRHEQKARKEAEAEAAAEAATAHGDEPIAKPAEQTEARQADRKRNKPKGLLKRVRVHASVIARIASGTDGYAPIVLPARYDVVPAGGMAETKLLDTTGGKPVLTEAEKADARKNPPPLVSKPTLAWLSEEAQAHVAGEMEAAWNLVWTRRLVYFLTVLATLALTALPWWIPPGIEKVPDAGTGLWQLPIVDAFLEAVGNLLRMIGEVLPGFLQRWISAWAESPLWFLLFLLAIFMSMRLGRRLERKIADVARANWHIAIPRIPPASAGQKPKFQPGGQKKEEEARKSLLAKVRNSHFYQRSIQLFKWLFLPNFVLFPLMIAAILWFAHAVILQFALPFIEARSFCQRSAVAPDIGQVEIDFRTNAACNPVGGSVKAGTTYTIAFEDVAGWKDGSYEATPAGLAAGDMRWGIGYLAAPFRRAIGSGYLQPLAAIRSKSTNGGFRFVQIRPLAMKPAEDDPSRFQAEFEAPASGELFLFANDAILLHDIDKLYGNNAGTARVKIVSAPHAAKQAEIAAAAEAEAAEAIEGNTR